MEVEFDSSPDDENISVAKLQKSAEAGKKGAKKRKKKTLSEPQKPVSAYALFFKDTQNAIKAENSVATFGEISKIVASMWDSLSEEAKQVYKQKTETAKREYLKQLAAYRAAKEEEGEDEPLFILQDKLKQQRIAESNTNLPPPPKLKIAPVLIAKGVNLLPSPPSMTQSGASSADGLGENSTPISPNQGTSNPALSTTSPTLPPPIQLRNIVPKAQGSVTIFQGRPGQVIKLLPASQASSIANNSDGKNRIIKMADLIKNGSSSTSPQQPQSPSENDVQPILQTLAQETGTLESDTSTPKMENGTEGLLSIAKGEVILIDDMDEYEAPVNAMNAEEKHENSVASGIRVCVRENCENLAISDPQWKEEYCSASCVVKHCRDVFDAWTSLRRTNVSAG